MAGPFVRCYRFPPDITRRRVVRTDFLINSVLLVWTRRLVRSAYRLSGAPTRFVTDKRNSLFDHSLLYDIFIR